MERHLIGAASPDHVKSGVEASPRKSCASKRIAAKNQNRSHNPHFILTFSPGGAQSHRNERLAHYCNSRIPSTNAVSNAAGSVKIQMTGHYVSIYVSTA